MTMTNAVITVTPCEVLIANPSLNPVISLKALAFMMNLVPSLKDWSLGPIMKRIKPLIRNITPTDTIMNVTGEARFTR